MLPWESASRDAVYGATRRRQDSAADSGSSSSDVSAAVAVAERTRRLPQQSTLDGGLRGAPPPLRRLSAVEPRHLAPLGSPPHSPRPPRPAPAPAPSYQPPPHPTPTISVSSAPDDESGSPEERRSLAPSDEPSSVFASADATPTEPLKSLEERCALLEKTVSSPSCDNCSRTDDSKVEVKVLSPDASTSACAPPESRDEVSSGGRSVKNPDPSRKSEDDIVSVQITLSRQSSTIKEISPASSKDSSKIGDLPESTPERESAAESSPGSTSGGAPAQGRARAPVAPLAVCEDIGVDDDNVDKVPSAPLQRVSGDSTAASESDSTKPIAHKDETSSVSDSDIVKRDNKSDSGESKQRNDICPWEDE